MCIRDRLDMSGLINDPNFDGGTVSINGVGIDYEKGMSADDVYKQLIDVYKRQGACLCDRNICTGKCMGSTGDGRSIHAEREENPIHTKSIQCCKESVWG